MQHRRVTWVAAACAVLLRLVAAHPPLRADEAGFLLVARSWDPRPGQLYGDYFVDRPPPLVAVIRAVDWAGPPELLRVLGALLCGVLVLAAARLGREIGGERAVGWTAVTAAALSVNPMIDVVAVKGEQLGTPLVLLSVLCAVLALRRESLWLAALAGLLAGAAPGFKQNLVDGIVFAVVLLVAARVAGQITTRTTLRLGVAGLVGGAVPGTATLAWAALAGVRLDTLWYATYGFRFDASMVLADESGAAADRAWLLIGVAVATGLAGALVLYLVRLRDAWQADPALTCATIALGTIGVTGVVAGGSYWRDYLHPLVPVAVLCTAALAARPARPDPPPRDVRVLVAATAVSCGLGFAGWVVADRAGLIGYTEWQTGEAVGAVAEDGDTLVVYGGRADIQYAAGLPAPYRHLWSLPMRTLDPDLTELRGLVTGRHPPTWIVEWVDFGAWHSQPGEQLRELVEERYVEHGTGCDDRPVFLLRGVERAPLEAHCD